MRQSTPFGAAKYTSPHEDLGAAKYTFPEADQDRSFSVRFGESSEGRSGRPIAIVWESESGARCRSASSIACSFAKCGGASLNIPNKCLDSLLITFAIHLFVEEFA